MKIFLNKLALHVQNLYDRSKVNNFTRNDSLLDIKMSYPLIYDISVFISSYITEQLDILLSDDEISFIALHIGAYFEAELNDKEALKAVLISYEYPEIIKQLQKKIEKLCADEIEIADDTWQIDKNQQPFIITTNRKVLLKYPGAVLVHPFLTKKDEEKIRHRVAAIKNFQHQEKMFHYIDKYFDASLFFGQIDPASYTKKSHYKPTSV
ncbi:PRD domain-containing protein [Listeria fleischmannii]|uniref:PRD domain-containing protein n=1 Tax=Listeria fleischmannii TaxID=1069827 RepID=UPI00068F0EB7|nr:PRD domain-containing protein [Listeria fleischmannii]